MSLLLLSYLRPKWEVLQGLGLIDLLVIPVAIGISFYLVLIYYFKYNTRKETKFLIPGYFASVLSGLLFAGIYNYFYQGGDTFWYYDYSQYFRKAFEENIFVGSSLFFSPPASTNPEFLRYMAPMGHLYYARADPEMIFMFKIIGLIEAILIPSYWVTTLVFSFFVFTGKWALFSYLCNRYPGVDKFLAISILFVPSILFWGTGILKDTLCLGSLCWLIVHFLKFIDNPKQNLYRIIGFLIFFKIILILKAYLVLALIGPAALYVYNTHKPNSNIILLKYISIPIVLAAFIVSSGVLLNSIASTSQKYQLDQLEKKAEGFRTYHTYLARTQGQSYYSLGEVSYTPIGIVAKIPAAFNVTYFRPYPWEVNEPLQYLSSLESILLFFVFLYIIIKLGPLIFFQQILNDKLISMLMLYSIILGTSIGLTAYNFGALVRFKIPGTMSLAIALTLIYVSNKSKNKSIKNHLL